MNGMQGILQGPAPAVDSSWPGKSDKGSYVGQPASDCGRFGRWLSYFKQSLAGFHPPFSTLSCKESLQVLEGEEVGGGR